MEVLVKVDSKAVEKLIDVVSKGIGTLYRPRQIRREADAQAYAIKVLGKAKADVDSETRMMEVEAEERISRRIAARECRRQENIDDVVEMAAKNLAVEATSVSEKPVDVDWAARFFNIVQDVSREEMKVFWAKILAKEIERPTTFSLRTLEVLRNITAEEAATFEKIAQFVFDHNGFFVYNDSELLESVGGIHYVDLALLTECGILQSGDFVIKQYRSLPDKESVSAIVYGKHVVIVKLPIGSKGVDIPVVLLTKVGQELLGLLDPVFNLEYLHAFARMIKKENPSAIIQYAELISLEGEMCRYKAPLVDLK